MPALPSSYTSGADASRRLRFTIYALTIIMCVICYGDRAALSVAMPRVAKEFGLSPSETGWVLSSFLWSYFFLNLPSAITLDRIGTRLVGAAAVTLWSLAMIFGSVATTVPAFIATRILLGVGESPTFALGNKVMRYWARPGERGLMMTAFICGIPIGLATGAIASAWLVETFGWRSTFSILGALGLMWSLAWLWIYPSKSALQVSDTRDAFALISIPTLFRSRDFWGIVIPQCCGNYANFLLMSWLPTILRDTFHLSLMQSGLYTAYSYLGATMLSLALGKLGERSVRNAETTAGTRRHAVSFFLAMASMLGAFPLCHSPFAAIALLIVAIACVTAGTGANMALLADLLVERGSLGSVTGLTLTFSNGLGIAAPVLTGYLLQATGNFHAVFYIAAFIILVGSVAVFLMPRRHIHAHRTITS
ncbi:MFS transporter [Acetobacter sacchari]